jgi:FkbM family methyltransferase
MEKNMTTYSQVRQDLWVLKNIPNGFFLDIGAFDGVKYSNSLLLEENGWNGLLVEANSFHEKSIKLKRKSNYVITAISDFDGIISLELDNSTGMKISEKETIKKVNCTRFDTLFAEHNIPQLIHYMSLDIEGYEFKALTTFPFRSHKIHMITLEHNLYCDGPANKLKIKKLLSDNGYFLIKEDVMSNNLPFEDWYVHYDIKDSIRC